MLTCQVLLKACREKIQPVLHEFHCESCFAFRNEAEAQSRVGGNRHFARAKKSRTPSDGHRHRAMENWSVESVGCGRHRTGLEHLRRHHLSMMSGPSPLHSRSPQWFVLPSLGLSLLHPPCFDCGVNASLNPLLYVATPEPHTTGQAKDWQRDFVQLTTATGQFIDAAFAALQKSSKVFNSPNLSLGSGLIYIRRLVYR